MHPKGTATGVSLPKKKKKKRIAKKREGTKKKKKKEEKKRKCGTVGIKFVGHMKLAFVIYMLLYKLATIYLKMVAKPGLILFTFSFILYLLFDMFSTV